MANPYAQFATANTNPYAQFAGETEQEQPGLVYDAGKAAGAGIVKGIIGLTALPGTVEQLGRMGINYAAGKEAVAPQAQYAPTYDDIKGAYEQRAGKLYEPRTTLGKYVGTVAEFAPGMLFPGGAGASLARKALTNVVAPAVASETAGQMTAGTSAEPYARIAGGVVGGMVPNAVGRVISPSRVDPERLRQSAVLAQEGVPVTAGQVTGSNPLRYAESVAVDTPFAGGRAKAVMDTQAERFTAATLRRAGIDAPRATPEVIDDAFRRIGNEFNQAASVISVPLARVTPAGTPVVTPVVRQVERIASDYERITPAATASGLPRSIADELAAMAQSNSLMDGRTYLRWRSELGRAARGAQDATTRDAVYDIQRALDLAAERWLRRPVGPARGNIPAPRDLSQYADRLRNARNEYRNMLVIERAATGAGENAANGLISPAALRNAVVQQNRRSYARGQGDFGELARAGEALMKPLPQSGTGPRVGVQLMGTTLGGGIGAMFGGPVAGPIAGAAIGQMAGPAIMGRAVMSPWMQAYLRNQAAAGLRDMPRGSRFAPIPGLIVQGND